MLQNRLKSLSTELSQPTLLPIPKYLLTLHEQTELNQTGKGARVVEEARLESVYTPKGYREFESLPFRWEKLLY